MKIYVLSSGEKVKAKSARELVEYLYNTSWFAGARSVDINSIDEYMLQFADRCLRYPLNAIVRFDTAENFVEDLYKHGIITHKFLAN